MVQLSSKYLILKSKLRSNYVLVETGDGRGSVREEPREGRGEAGQLRGWGPQEGQRFKVKRLGQEKCKVSHILLSFLTDSDI